ncbi:MAG: reductive dehalogenase [Anaerolineaceae bacterium]|nr:reductive dehalogenase [Anaerolineaceae bacterium]
MAKQPHYTEDVIGEIKRFDERDTMFARQDLIRYFGENSEQYRRYFSKHPEEEKFHQQLSRKIPLGGSNPLDAPMFDAQFNMLDKLGAEAFVDGEPAEEKAKFTPERASIKVKETARRMGADLVGIGPLKKEWVYSHAARICSESETGPQWGTAIDLSAHHSAVALGFSMDLNLNRSAPYFPTLLATAQAYSRSGWTAVQLAEYIRELGYSARAHHFANYQVLAVPVAVDCGLGELSRAGYLITKKYGLGVRLSVVTTNMPLAYDAPVDIGVQSFCEQCKLCAEECPSGAIPSGGKVLHNGVLKWKLDEKKCYAYWHVNGTDCGICMAVCPWTKPRTTFHKIMAEIASVKGPHQRFMAWANRTVYGRHKPAPYPSFLEMRNDRKN